MIRRPPRSTLFPYNDALPIYVNHVLPVRRDGGVHCVTRRGQSGDRRPAQQVQVIPARDRKSTRLNSSHANISYAVFCLKNKKKLSATPCTHHTSRLPSVPPPH